MSTLTHLTPEGDARMVEVGEKAVTRREAVAEGWVRLSPEALAQVMERRAKKGDVLTIAQIAGIQGAKRTAEWIPLCHPVPLDGVDVRLHVEQGAIRIEASARCTAKTGVEMEALTAVTAAALTVYDMLKAVDRGIVIDGVRLLAKSGGRSGEWKAPGRRA